MTFIKRETRIRVYERDNNQCVECHSSDNLTVDHIRPLTHGGNNSIHNLQTLCWKCNQKKGGQETMSIKERIRRIWNIVEIFAEFKNSIVNMVTCYKSEIKQFIESETKKQLLERSQSMTDKYDLKNLPLKLVGLENSLVNKDKKILELQETIIMLTEYLDIECVPGKHSKPHFVKK